MKLMVVGFLLLTFGSNEAFCQEADFDGAARKYINHLNTIGSPVFYSSCETTYGQSVLIFGAAETTGRLMDFKNGLVVDLASVFVKHGQLILNFDQTQGGMYTYARMRAETSELSKFNFTLFIPHNLLSLRQLKPTQRCTSFVYPN